MPGGASQSGLFRLVFIRLSDVPIRWPRTTIMKFSDSRIDIVIESDEAHHVSINDHEAGTFVAVTRLACRTDIDDGVGRADRVLRVYGFRCHVLGYGVNAGDMEMATEKDTVKTVEYSCHPALVVNVLWKQVVVVHRTAM